MESVRQVVFLSMFLVYLCWIPGLSCQTLYSASIYWIPTGRSLELQFYYHFSWTRQNITCTGRPLPVCLRLYTTNHIKVQILNRLNGYTWACTEGCSGRDIISDLHNLEFAEISSYGDDNWEAGEETLLHTFDNTDSFNVKVKFTEPPNSTISTGLGDAMVSLATRNDTNRLNASPSVLVLPIYRVPLGCTLQIDLSPFDGDGDYVICRWSDVNGNLTSADLDESSCRVTVVASTVNGFVTDEYYRGSLHVEDFSVKEVTLKHNVSVITRGPFSRTPVLFTVHVLKAPADLKECDKKPKFERGTADEDKSIVLEVPFSEPVDFISNFVNSRMVRNYKKKTTRAETRPEVIENAVNEVMFFGRSVRSVATEIGVSHQTLGRYVNKALVTGSRALKVGYSSHHMVFTTEQENNLKDYIIRAANIYFGLSPKSVRSLAYECAVEFGVKMPDEWRRNKSAGRDWFSGFLKRNHSLSIRTPEPTSLSRATSFNHNNVKLFFEKLALSLERDQIQPHNIWNIDETGITTVQKPTSVVAPKGAKQIGSLTSGERGSLVTMCAAVNALGNTVPPMFIFPRVKFHDHFIRDGPLGCIGASYPSGWMTADNFHLFVKHFAKFAKPSKEQKVLLLLDNHHSHIGLDTIEFAKENGIVMLSFPPHCSHKLQPLDRTVFGPFKRYFSSAQDIWMRNNPAKTMSIYDLPGIVREAWPKAAIPENIMSGFKVAGINPYNPDIFQENDFAPAYVTDRPKPSPNEPAVFSSAPPNDSIDQNGSRDNDVSQSMEATDSCVTTTVSDQLLAIGRKIEVVPGDGHCLLHAVAISLAAEGLGEVTVEMLCTMLMKEISDHVDFYTQFSISNDRDVVNDIDRYVRFKEFNNDTADLILSALCNCLGISAVIYNQSTATRETRILATGPGRPNVVFRGDIYLILTGINGNAHYNGVVKAVENAEVAHVEPSTCSANVFSPEKIRPFPKAPKRTCKGTQKRRKSAILTDTPEKRLIEEQQKSKSISKAKKGLKKALNTTKKNKKKRKPKPQEIMSSDEEDYYCLVCVEPYSNSRSREAWIQCVTCKQWSHEECTDVRKNHVYICHNCDSDYEDE